MCVFVFCICVCVQISPCQNLPKLLRLQQGDFLPPKKTLKNWVLHLWMCVHREGWEGCLRDVAACQPRLELVTPTGDTDAQIAWKMYKIVHIPTQISFTGDTAKCLHKQCQCKIVQLVQSVRTSVCAAASVVQIQNLPGSLTPEVWHYFGWVGTFHKIVISRNKSPHSTSCHRVLHSNSNTQFTWITHTSSVTLFCLVGNTHV